MDEEGRGAMWNLDEIDEPLGDEATHVQAMDSVTKHSSAVTLRLAFLSLGVVYGDLGTSPLYVFSNIFPNGIKHGEDVLGALSCIIYTITLIALVKYVLIALSSNDNGEGGTFALYSLICRHVKVNTIPNQHPTDKELTTYIYRPVSENSAAFKLKKLLEHSPFLQKVLLVLVLLGTSMVIGDGALSPAISGTSVFTVVFIVHCLVLSAVQGLRVSHVAIREGPVLVLALIILIILFSMQRFGTARLGFMFAPVIFIWFISIFVLGVYNIIVYYPGIFRAICPRYIIRYFMRQKTDGFVSLGGVVLAVTGAEALFADLGHFSQRSIQLAFTVMVFPCLLVAYMGQAAYLMKKPNDVSEAFYNSLPNQPYVYWPFFLIATAAAVIASQATISATFSIIKQAVALGCFPRVKIIHTSNKFLGQIYIPEVNWVLMIVCLFITAGFGKTQQIGTAYGIAVVAVMLVTTLLLALVMILIWQRNLFLVVAFLLLFGFIESGYVSAVLFKVKTGGWVPLAIGTVLMLIMYTWHYGCVQSYEFEMQNKVSLGWILQLGPSLGMVRLPGIGLFYTELAHGVPSTFSHFLTHFPAVHSILMFVCVKYLPVSTVPKEERFLIRRIGPKELRMYRCAVRYGYQDLHKKDDHFDDMLIQTLASFIRCEMLTESISEEQNELGSEVSSSFQGTPTRYLDQGGGASATSASIMSEEILPTSAMMMHRSSMAASDEAGLLIRSREEGIVHMMGNTVMRAREGSSLWKKLAINYGHGFLQKVCRANSVIYHVPHESLLHIGMVYRV